MIDQGAHFHRSDLQVHTPRDRQWHGQCPQNEAERKAFARELIADCREKGIDAIAVTDHHDIAFLPYIRSAAQEERRPGGEPVPPEGRLVVFPGVELTLGVPCQALVLFDSDLPTEHLQLALDALAIPQADHSEAKALAPTRLEAYRTLVDLCRRLDEYPALKGKYILLPNVNDGGDHTILRHGFAAQYKIMPCVGGYIDGAIEGHSRLNILNGNDPEWGSRATATIQTSDSRSRDFGRLGRFTTWIKWARPTAEALRQACLAKESRIQHGPPMLPSRCVRSVSVSNSKFFGAFKIDFNPEMNVLIGGRGTGESSILEYIRWALCDQPVIVEEGLEFEIPEYQMPRGRLIEGTLRLFDGVVTVEYVIDGVVHTVTRDSRTGKVSLAVAGSEATPATERQVNELCGVQGYSQKQLSSVSVRSAELTRFLEAPIAERLRLLDSEIEALASQIKDAFVRNEERRRLELDLKTLDFQLRSRQERVAAIQAAISELSEADKATIDAHPLYLEGDRQVNQYTTALEGVVGILRDAEGRLRTAAAAVSTPGETPNRDDLSRVRDLVVRFAEEARQALRTMLSRGDEARTSLQELFTPWREAFEEHVRQYEAAHSQNAAMEHKIGDLKRLSDEMSQAHTEIVRLRSALQELGDTAAHLAAKRTAWKEKIRTVTALRQQQAEELTTRSNRELRVTVRVGQDCDAIKDGMAELIRGAAITRVDKLDRLFENIRTSAEPLTEWLAMCEELGELAGQVASTTLAGELTPTPLLTGATFIESELRRIAGRLNPDRVLTLSLSHPRDVPVFEYRAEEDTYIPFENASPGQQATALLSILLNETGSPLIIDQPEEDLDNSTISGVVELLWQAKERRQIILSSHNANIVVNGDAELVVHCDYHTAEDRSQGRISSMGAIDVPEIRSTIQAVMEGGPKAFELRWKKYGF